MGKCVDSSHEGNGTPGHGIVFPAVEKLLSAVGALIDLDVGGAGPSGRALALVTRRQGELIDASAKCDAKVAVLRRQLAAANERVAELEKERGELRDEWPMFEYVDDTEGMVAIEVPETVIQNFHRILGGGK